MLPNEPPVVAVMGPTASGKTALALDLAEHLPVSLISVDSAQVYRRLDIGAAKPDAETLRRAPHQLIDIREPWDSYSAADFAEDARRACKAAWEQRCVPVLVGGTMLYFRALEYGLSPLPSADEAIREQLRLEIEQRGLESLHRELAGIDPDAADRIHPNDPQRLMRALEVYRISGQTLSELQAIPGTRALNARWLKLVVCPAERRLLHRRIESRFLQMLEQGLVDEVRALRRDPRIVAELPAMRSVGYRQVWEHLDGEYDLEELCRRGVYATRQLAKRQITWLRKEGDALWLDPDSEDWMLRARASATRFVDSFL